MSVENEDWAAGCGCPFDGSEKVLGTESTPKGRHGVDDERLPETPGSHLGLLLPIAASLAGGDVAAFIKLLSGGRYGG